MKVYNSVTISHGGRRGLNFVQSSFILTQEGQKSFIKDTWMILDMATMERVTNNESFVTNVTQCMADTVLTVITNGGSQVSDKEFMCRLMPLHVHVNIYSMEIILALKDVADIKGVRVTIATAI